jgi:3-hydroxymyristoyl/3-hydroxydecanoyl-(acyl carrier protein) dehydratase
MTAIPTDTAPFECQGLIDARIWTEDGAMAVRATIDSAHVILADHFPGYPTVPGFLQLHWVLQVGGMHASAESSPLEIEHTKFVQRLAGGESIMIRVEAPDFSRERAAFSITLNGVVVTSGRIRAVSER